MGHWGRPGLRLSRVSPRACQWAIILGGLIVLEAVTRGGLVSRTTLAAPTAMLTSLIESVGSGEIWPHLARTLMEVAASFGIGAAVGIPLGVLFWRVPYLGRVFEPYLVSLYAMPLVFFYPLLLAILGLGSPPIIVIASTMSLVPIVLNTRVGFAEVPAIYPKVGKSVGCTVWQTYWKILLPAATPLVFAGLKLGFVYALIGTVASEFVLTDAGLGFVVHYNYNFFETPTMYGYIALILLVAVVANYFLLKAEASLKGRS